MSEAKHFEKEIQKINKKIIKKRFKKDIYFSHIPMTEIMKRRNAINERLKRMLMGTFFRNTLSNERIKPMR